MSTPSPDTTAPEAAAPSAYTIIYSPPAYGEVIAQSECRHDPAGHRMELGLTVEPANPKKPNGRRVVIIRGQFCMKCGWCWHVETAASSAKTPARPGSSDWWSIWEIAKAEFGDKCWQFACRLSVLAEQIGHLSRLLGLPQCRSQARAQAAHRVVRYPVYAKREAPRKRPPLKYAAGRRALPFIAKRRGLS